MYPGEVCLSLMKTPPKEISSMYIAIVEDLFYVCILFRNS